MPALPVVRGPEPRPWLRPAGFLFGCVGALRAGLYRRGFLPQAHLDGPVISVGNLSVGGSGKTPVVARIAEILRDAGLPVSVLSRGYGGTFRGEALVVGDGKAVLADASLAGDEPVMLARSLPGVVVAVGPRRDRVGREVERRFGRRVHVLDDGFQHLRLARDLDVLCLSTADLRDRPLPAGRLREFPRAASRAHVVLWPDGESPVPSARARDDVFVVSRTIDGFVDLHGREQPAPSRPLLVAGIANPGRFASDVAWRVERVVGCVLFPDHHPFSLAEVERAVAQARALGADAVVTTAKDAVRLPDLSPELPLLVGRLSVTIADEERFRARLLAVAGRWHGEATAAASGDLS